MFHTDDLLYSASMFKTSAKGLRSHFWWQQCKVSESLSLFVLSVIVFSFTLQECYFLFIVVSDLHSVHPATYLFNICYILNVATLTER